MQKKFDMHWAEEFLGRTSGAGRWQSMGEEAARPWYPTSGAGVAFVMIGALLTLVGGHMVWQRKQSVGRSFGTLAAGLGIMAFCLMPTNVHFHPFPHHDWMWVVPIFAAWWFTKFGTPRIKLDDWVFKSWCLIAWLGVMGLRGLLGGESPVSAFWALLTLIWIVFVSEAFLARFAERPGPRNLSLFFGWYLLAVLA